MHKTSTKQQHANPIIDWKSAHNTKRQKCKDNFHTLYIRWYIIIIFERGESKCVNPLIAFALLANFLVIALGRESAVHLVFPWVEWTNPLSTWVQSGMPGSRNLPTVPPWSPAKVRWAHMHDENSWRHRRDCAKEGEEAIHFIVCILSVTVKKKNRCDSTQALCK